MKNTIKRYLLVWIQAMLCLPVLAQQTAWEDPETGKGEIKEANFTVIIDRVNTLPPAFRTFQKVDIQEPKQHFEAQSYEFNDYRLGVPDIECKVKILGVKADEPTPVMANYLKAGFGNYVTPYLDLFLGSKEKESFLYGVRLKHLSSANGPVSKSGNSNNDISLYGKYFMKDYTLSGGIDYNRKKFNFYGFDRSASATEPSANDIEQVIHNTVANVQFETNAQDNTNLTFKSNLQYSYLSEYDRATENEVILNVAPKYELDKDRAIVGNVNIAYSNKLDFGTALNRFMMVLRPQYALTVSKYRLKAGFDFTYENDTTKSTSNAHFYPLFSAETDLIENKIIAEAGFDGGMEKNTLRSVLDQNLFVGRNANISNTNKKMDFYAGLKGALLKNVMFATKLSYRTYKNMFFFVNDEFSPSKFQLLYDNGNTTLLKYNAEVSYSSGEKFRIGVKGEYNHYETSKITNPWQRPSFVSNVFVTYNLKNKILFYFDVYNMAGLVAKDDKTGKETNLNAIFDANLRVDYRYSQKFSAFLETNNIFAQKYQRYLYYPNKGFNLLLGITYRF